MKSLLRISIVLLVVCMTIGMSTSCSDDNNCSMAGRPMMYCLIQTINPDNPKTVLKDTLDLLTITALGTDSIILNQEMNVDSLTLPLRYDKDTTVFIFHYDSPNHPTYVDTLYVMQQNTPYFQSMECGYMMKQKILKVRFGKIPKNRQPVYIDSLHILRNDANSNGIQNLQIFYNYR